MMNGIALIIACALGVGLGALLILFWAINSGQYDDPEGDAMRILIDDPADRDVQAVPTDKASAAAPPHCAGAAIPVRPPAHRAG